MFRYKLPIVVSLISLDRSHSFLILLSLGWRSLHETFISKVYVLYDVRDVNVIVPRTPATLLRGNESLPLLLLLHHLFEAAHIIDHLEITL